MPNWDDQGGTQRLNSPPPGLRWKALAADTQGMQAMSRQIMALLMVFALAVPALAERPRPLGWALEAVRNGNWENAKRLAARDGPVAEDVIEWLRLRGGHGRFDEVQDFLARRPDWPGLTRLRSRSEEVVIPRPAADILEFFAEAAPRTPEAVLAHARALTETGQKAAAGNALVAAWKSMPMETDAQDLFLKKK